MSDERGHGFGASNDSPGPESFPSNGPLLQMRNVADQAEMVGSVPFVFAGHPVASKWLIVLLSLMPCVAGVSSP